MTYAVWNWTFRSYVDGRGHQLVQDWYDSPPIAAIKVEFDWLLKRLRDRPLNDWSTLGGCTALKGRLNRGLLELRFEVERTPVRPIGIFGVGRQVFTILAIASKSDIQAQCVIARARKVQVEANPEVFSYESVCLSNLVRKAP